MAAEGAARAPHPARRQAPYLAGRAPRRPATGAGGCERAPPPCPPSLARVSRGSAERRPGSPQPQSCRRQSFVRRRRRRRRLRVPPAGGGETRKGKEEEGREAAARGHSPAAPTSRGSAVCGSRPARAPRPRPGPARPPVQTAAPAAAAPPARPGRRHPEPPASLRRARAAGAASMCRGAASAPRPR